MRKVYAVVEYGGQYEDKWENIIGICATKDIAEQLVLNNRNYSDLEISEARWAEMTNAIWDYEYDNDVEFESTMEGLITLFPEYAVKDFELAEAAYDNFDDYVYTGIKEVNLYESKSDILNSGTDD